MEKIQTTAKTPKATTKLSIHLPTDTVRFLREICKAGGITVDEFTDVIMGGIVEGSVGGTQDAESLILDLWIHNDREATATAMNAVVARWVA